MGMAPPPWLSILTLPSYAMTPTGVYAWECCAYTLVNVQGMGFWVFVSLYVLLIAGVGVEQAAICRQLTQLHLAKYMSRNLQDTLGAMGHSNPIMVLIPVQLVTNLWEGCWLTHLVAYSTLPTWVGVYRDKHICYLRVSWLPCTTAFLPLPQVLHDKSSLFTVATSVLASLVTRSYQPHMWHMVTWVQTGCASCAILPWTALGRPSR